MTAAAIKLTREQAVAQRMLLNRFAHRAYWEYFSGKVAGGSEEQPPHAHPSLEATLVGLFRDLNLHTKTVSPRAKAAALHIAAAQNLLRIQAQQWSSRTLEQLSTAVFVPIYRGLAGEPFDPLLVEADRMMAESLAVVGLINELGPDFVEALDAAAFNGTAPHDFCTKSLGLDLARLAAVLVRAGYQWDQENDFELFELIAPEAVQATRAAWASPRCLWKLAGEILSDHAEFILPREWINVPLPWHDIASQHQAILAHLSRSSSPVAPDPESETPVHLPKKKPNAAQPGQANTNDARNPIGASHWLRGDSANIERTPDAGSTPAQSAIGAIDIESSIEATVSDLIETVASEVAPAAANDTNSVRSERPSIRRHTSHGNAAEGESSTDPVNEALVPTGYAAPKILLAEVRSHNDPAFVGVIRRQLATARQAGHTVTLCALRIQPESEHEETAINAQLKNGLAAWQQRFVNRIAENPHITQPYAFISGHGELILCLLDIERNEMTTLAREAIVEILSGKNTRNQSTLDVARVAIAARYFAGIASVSAPSASFSAEQLIEATYRCLAAVECQGKSSIKSIEAF